MATEDGFQPDRPPIFLSGLAEETGQPNIGKAWDIATISSRILKTSMLAVAVTAIGIAVLSVGNPVTLVANVTDWWVDKPALQPAAPSTSPIQTIADTQDAPPATTDAPARTEIAAAVEPADQSQAEIGQRQAGQKQAEASQPLTEALFKQFQAWAAEEETRAQAAPAQAAPVRGWRKMPRRGFGPRKNTDRSGPCKMHARRSGPSDIIA